MNVEYNVFCKTFFMTQTTYTLSSYDNNAIYT